MKIALLQCDHVMPELAAHFGDFSEFFSNLFSAHSQVRVALDVFDVTARRYPDDLDAYDGFMGTGSRFSVYDDLDWIKAFSRFVVRLFEEKRKFIGICFGHQMIAQALGGRCEQAKAGWGLGAKEMSVYRQKDWMSPEKDRIFLLMSHLDQVSALPENAEVLAGNEHCPYGMFALQDHFLGIQGHPEFSAPYLEKLMESRIGRIGRAEVDGAVKTLGNPTDEAVVTKWMINFLR